MAKPIAAAFLFDSVWGDDTGPKPTPPRPMIDWQELQDLLTQHPNGELRLTIGLDGKFRLA